MISAVARQFQLFSVLRHRDFRIFWIGLQAQVIGQQMMQFTMGWLAFELTKSPLMVGSVVLFLGVPPLTVGLFGGVFADRVDQRKVIRTAQSIATVGMGILATLTITQNIETWHLMVAAFTLGSLNAFDQPSRQSYYPQLLPDRALLAQAVPLNAMAWQFARPVAPVIGGFIIATVGTGITQGAGQAFALGGAGMLAMAVLIGRVPAVSRPQGHRASVLRNLVDGLSYVRHHSVFRVLLPMTYVNSFAGLGFMFVLPVFAGEVLEVDARGLAALWAAGGIGAFVAVLTTPLTLERFGPGRVMIFQGLLFGVALLGFSFTRTLAAGAVLQVVVGMGSLAYMMAVEVSMQTLVPDEFRGRVMSLYGLAWTMPALGAAVLNIIANFIGAPGALALGAGIVLVNVSLVALFSATVRNFTLRPAETPDATAVEA